MSDYARFIKPVLEMKLDGDLITVEGNTLDETAKMLDALAGIDLWYANREGMYGIASRIQRGKAWRTFTVRKSRESGAKTEYEKRKWAMDRGYLYPRVTFQAYIGDADVCMAIAMTEDIFACIDRGLCLTRKTGDHQKGQAYFYVISWDDMKDNNYRISELNYPMSALNKR
jgi:hypothetical protein